MATKCDCFIFCYVFYLVDSNAKSAVPVRNSMSLKERKGLASVHTDNSALHLSNSGNVRMARFWNLFIIECDFVLQLGIDSIPHSLIHGCAGASILMRREERSTLHCTVGTMQLAVVKCQMARMGCFWIRTMRSTCH